MSLFIEKEENLSTLDDLVAFIDSVDTGKNNSADVTTSESENDDSPYNVADVESMLLDSLDDMLEDASFLPKTEAKPKTSAPKKKKNIPGASTRLQRRKKAEIMGLKVQSLELERRLEELKHTKCSTSWLTIAATQYQERLRSESVNQKLRAVLKEHLKVNRFFRDVFQKHFSLGNLDAVFGKQSDPTRYPTPGADTSLTVLGEFETLVEGLYLDSEVVFRLQSVPYTSSTLQVTRGQRHGSVFEISATTPLPCSMSEAGAMIWRECLTMRSYRDKSYRFLRQRRPSSVEKNFSMVLRSASSVKTITGLSFMRKIEESNRVVLVDAGRILLPTQGLQFRVQCWTVITRFEDASQPRSIVRTLVQLHVENAEEFTPKREDLQDAENFVLEALGGKIQEYRQRQQRTLIDEAEQIRLASKDSVAINH